MPPGAAPSAAIRSSIRSGDAVRRAAPAGMDGRDHAGGGVAGQDGHAVGDQHRQADARLGGDDAVAVGQFGRSARRPVTAVTVLPCTCRIQTTSPGASPAAAATRPG